MKNIKEKADLDTMNKEGLINYTRHIEKRFRNLETENQLLNAERLRLEQELHSLRNEIDRLREPPLLVGVIVDFIDNTKDKAIILSSTGPVYSVGVSRKVKSKELKPGMLVLVNQRTFAIMEIVNINLDYYEEANKVMYRGLHSKIHELLINNQTALIEYSKVNEKLLSAMENMIKKLNK